MMDSVQRRVGSGFSSSSSDNVADVFALNAVENGEGGSQMVTKTPSLDSVDVKKQAPKPTASHLPLAVLVAVWYGTAIAAITTSKRIMMQFPLPFLLCTTQFVVASVVVGFYSRTSKTYRPIPAASWVLVHQIAVSYTFGFIFTNTAFSLVSASFAETVKSGEPISSVLIGFLYLQERASTRTYLTLLPICVGVAVSCIHDDAFGWYGFFAAAASNVCFSARAVLAKYMNKTQAQGSGALDDMSLFLHISNTGPLILIPFAILFERGSFVDRVNEMTLYDGAGLVALLAVNGVAYATYNLSSFVGTCLRPIACGDSFSHADPSLPLPSSQCWGGPTWSLTPSSTCFAGSSSSSSPRTTSRCRSACSTRAVSRWPSAGSWASRTHATSKRPRRRTTRNPRSRLLHLPASRRAVGILVSRVALRLFTCFSASWICI